jgi:hypothetical protein
MRRRKLHKRYGMAKIPLRVLQRRLAALKGVVRRRGGRA